MASNLFGGLASSPQPATSPSPFGADASASSSSPSRRQPYQQFQLNSPNRTGDTSSTTTTTTTGANSILAGDHATPSAAAAPALISFDEFSKIRILEAGQFEASSRLKDECREFTQRIGDFNNIVKNFLELMNEKARQIESQKLQAIGQRNRVENEAENRYSRQARLNALIKEAQAEMDRLTAHFESLQKVEAEQQAFMDGFFNK